MGPEIMDSTHFTFYPIYCPPYSLFIRENDINIDKNGYKKNGWFYTLFINFNSRCLAPKNRRFAVRSICFLTRVLPHKCY